MRHVTSAAVLAVLLLAACSESSTAPDASLPEADAPQPGSGSSPVPSFSAALPGTNVSITSGSCTQLSTITGEVHCSYNISNPDQILINIWPEALMALEYQCVSASTGKVQSSGTRYGWAWLGLEGVTNANPTGADVKLNSATLSNTYQGKDQKYNACKKSQKPVITKHTMIHWEIYVDNSYVGQPAADYADVCYSNDADYGCTQ